MKKLLILMSLIPTFIFSNSWYFDNSLTYNYNKNFGRIAEEHNLLYNFKLGQDRKDIDFKWGIDVLIDPYNLSYFESSVTGKFATFEHNMYLNYKSKPFKYTKFTVDLETKNKIQENDLVNIYFKRNSDLFTAKIGHETTFNNKIQLYNRLHLGFQPAHTFQVNVQPGQLLQERSLNTEYGIDMGLNIPINDNLKFKIYASGLVFDVGFPISENIFAIRYQALGRVGLEYKNKIFTYEPSVQYEFYNVNKQFLTAKILNFDINPNDKLNIKLKTDFIYWHYLNSASEPRHFIADANLDILYKFKKNKLHFEPKLGVGFISDFDNGKYKDIKLTLTITPTVNLGYEIIDNLVLYADITPKVIITENYEFKQSKWNYYKIDYDIFAKIGVKYNW